jgi:hypothetical protein
VLLLRTGDKVIVEKDSRRREVRGRQEGCSRFEVVESSGAKEAQQAGECAGGKRVKRQRSTMR